MRWKAGRIQQYDEWRSWFAWYPVKIKGSWVWLETVKRAQLSPPEDIFVHPLYVAPWVYKHI